MLRVGRRNLQSCALSSMHPPGSWRSCAAQPSRQTPCVQLERTEDPAAPQKQMLEEPERLNMSSSVRAQGSHGILFLKNTDSCSVLYLNNSGTQMSTHSPLNKHMPTLAFTSSCASSLHKSKPWSGRSRAVGEVQEDREQFRKS